MEESLCTPSHPILRLIGIVVMPIMLLHRLALLIKEEMRLGHLLTGILNARPRVIVRNR